VHNVCIYIVLTFGCVCFNLILIRCSAIGVCFRNNSSNSAWNSRSNHRLGAASKHSSVSVGPSPQQQQHQNQQQQHNQQQRRSVRQTNPGLASSSGLKSTQGSPPPNAVTTATNRQTAVGGSNINTRGGANRIIHDTDISTRRKTRSGGATTGELNVIHT
jgi:hypothetical protein